MAVKTFDQIVQRVMDRMNLSDDTARERIGESINERYTWLCTSMGLQTSVQDTAFATTVIGSDELTFGPSPLKIEKLINVFNPAYPKPNLLGEVSPGELRLMVATTEPAQVYAIVRQGNDRVTIKLNTGDAATAYELGADVIVDKATLSGADVPTINAGFVNVLDYGAMATEYDKQEKDEKAVEYEAKFETRCSELRLFIAKSIMRDIYQGKTAPGPVATNRLVT